MSIDDVQLDVLVSGEEPDRRRRAAVVVVLVVLALVVAAGWYVDRRSRQAEVTSISTCAQQAVAEYRDSTSELEAMAEYVRPSLVFATEPTTRGLYGMVAHQAEGISGGLQQVRDRCAAIHVRGWHPQQRAALTAQLAFQDAQLAFLASTAVDGGAYYADQQQVSDSKTAAAAALAAARPVRPW